MAIKMRLTLTVALAAVALLFTLVECQDYVCDRDPFFQSCNATNTEVGATRCCNWMSREYSTDKNCLCYIFGFSKVNNSVALEVLDACGVNTTGVGTVCPGAPPPSGSVGHPPPSSTPVASPPSTTTLKAPPPHHTPLPRDDSPPAPPDYSRTSRSVYGSDPSGSESPQPPPEDSGTSPEPPPLPNKSTPILSTGAIAGIVVAVVVVLLLVIGVLVFLLRKRTGPIVNKNNQPPFPPDGPYVFPQQLPLKQQVYPQQPPIQHQVYPQQPPIHQQVYPQQPPIQQHGYQPYAQPQVRPQVNEPDAQLPVAPQAYQTPPPPLNFQQPPPQVKPFVHQTRRPPPPQPQAFQLPDLTPPQPPAREILPRSQFEPVQPPRPFNDNPWNPNSDPKPKPPPVPKTDPSKSTMTYEELCQATDGFSEENLLGEGRLGLVYSGRKPDDGRCVAVKKFRRDTWKGIKEKQLQKEIEKLSRVSHSNIVCLIGYCTTGDEKLLVYEFVPNDTLEFQLHGSDEGQQILSWSTRMNIALGSARGLAYLHEDCGQNIIHGDIKPSNILLDDKFKPKIADFGLNKFFDNNNRIVMGTFGYIAPEYAASGKLTAKSDVFSFGVVIVELITGLQPASDSGIFADRSMVDWATQLMTEAVLADDYSKLADERLEKKYDPQQMKLMVACALACLRSNVNLRPKMSEVLRILEGQMSMDKLNHGVEPGKSVFFKRCDMPDVEAMRKKCRASKVSASDQQYPSSEFSGSTSDK